MGKTHIKAYQKSWIKYSKYPYKWTLELAKKCKYLGAEINENLSM